MPNAVGSVEVHGGGGGDCYLQIHIMEPVPRVHKYFVSHQNKINVAEYILLKAALSNHPGDYLYTSDKLLANSREIPHRKTKLSLWVEYHAKNAKLNCYHSPISIITYQLKSSNSISMVAACFFIINSSSPICSLQQPKMATTEPLYKDHPEAYQVVTSKGGPNRQAHLWILTARHATICWSVQFQIRVYISMFMSHLTRS